MKPPVLDFRDANERLAAHAGALRSLGVARLSLFGSVLRGCPTAESDVDLLVEFAPGMKSYDAFLAVCDLLEEELGRRVGLITVESLSPLIGPHILAEATDVLRAA